MKFKFMRKKQLNPSLLLIFIFIIGIGIGTLLLKLPAAYFGHLEWIDALFTATSAMTVTGLTVVDTATKFTLFGQIVILFLIKIGGLGIMTLAVIIFVALGKKIGLKERILVQQSLNQESVGGIIHLVKYVFVFSLIIELIGALFLSFSWVPQYGLIKGIYYSLFHSIAAFNNSGFSIWTNNLINYVGDPTVNLVITILIIIGGIGFTVLFEIYHKRSLKSVSLHSYMMIYGTIVMTIVGTILIFLVEYNNGNTFGELSLGEKWWAAYFQTVTTRTAGFNSINIGDMDQTSLLLMIFYMFVGAGSTSTGGGIKLTTLIVILLSVRAYIKGRKTVIVKDRTIQYTLIFKSLAITTICLLWVFIACFLLTMTEKQSFLAIAFEVVSAFGTVGLTMGITAKLSFIGKIIIIATMGLGKLGALTLMYAITNPDQTKLKYPNAHILIG